MSATVGAALKKIAVALLTDKKVLKVVRGIVLGILIIIAMPIAAVLGIFSGSIHVDTDALRQQVVEQLTAEEQAKLKRVEDTMNTVEMQMKKKGFNNRVKEAQVLYTMVLSDYAADKGFAEKLVGCFEKKQTDVQLVEKINAAFGTSLTAEDFGKAMSGIRAKTQTTLKQTGGK